MKTELNDGGPAFPGIEGVNGYGYQMPMALPDQGVVWINLRPGMTLRDYFAAAALPGLIMNAEYGAQLQRRFDPEKRIAEMGDKNESPQEYVARLAGCFADAMIAEREKGAA